MPTSLKTFEEFDHLLADARREIETMFRAEPDDRAIASVRRQLDVLHTWTRGGRCPSQDEKDQLNFGLLADRELDTYPVADNLYKLASFVIYWSVPSRAMTLASARIEMPDDIAACFTHMVELGYTDGLPVIPPTEKLVADMIDRSGLAPDEVIGIMPPENGVATVEKLAINAVMAGCRPEYLPVIIAAVRAVTDPQFDLLGIQTTTNPVTPVLIVNGPIRTKLGINCGRGCLGPGFRANATIGRALKLALLNIGACPPGPVAKSIHGMPGRYTFCFGELEEESPWEPFHVERGYAASESTVSVMGGQGTINMWIGYSSPENICHSIADGMRFYASNGYLRGSGVPVIVMGTGHARLFAKAGWNKKRIREEIFRLTPIPLTHIPEERQISRPFYEGWSRDRSLNVCRSADDIAIIVAGGSEPYHLTYIPSFTHPEVMITKTIDAPKEA